MAYAFNYSGAVAMLRAVILATLTAAGEPPAMLPLATSAEQAAAWLEGQALPLTVLQLANGQTEEQGRGYFHQLPVTVHHLRALESGTGIAIETAMARMQGLAVQLATDYRMLSVSIDNTPLIERVHVGGLQAGNDSEMQMALAQNGQANSVCAVSLPVTLTWWETT